MICYVHALASDGITAVATCGHCGVGLCLEHLAESLAHSSGGTRLDCPHTLPIEADVGRWAGNLDRHASGASR